MAIESLKIGFATISVVGLASAEADSQGIDGGYTSHMHRIEVNVGIPPADQARALLHECIHAFFDIYRIKGNKLDEEDVCKALDGALTALLTDNPELNGAIQDAVHGSVPIVVLPS